MAVFRDKRGRDWHVDINVSSLRRVRDGGLGIDLLDITDETKRVAERLGDSPELFVGVLYEICRPEIETRGIAAEEFGESIDANALDAAVEALLESLASFIPRHRGRVMAQAAVQVVRLENLGLMNQLNQALAERGLSSFVLPESSASIPQT